MEGFGSDFTVSGFGGTDFSGDGNMVAVGSEVGGAAALSKEEEMKRRVERYRGLSTEEKRAKIREELAAEQKAKREAAEAAKKEVRRGRGWGREEMRRGGIGG